MCNEGFRSLHAAAVHGLPSRWPAAHPSFLAQATWMHVLCPLQAGPTICYVSPYDKGDSRR